MQFLSLFFPLRCAGCNIANTSLCQTCIHKIPLAQDVEQRDTFAVFEYGNHIVENAIRDLKYHRKSEAARALMRSGTPYIIEYISTALTAFSPEHIILVPIPQHKKKILDRGFNQSELLTKELSQSIEHATVRSVLIKYRATIPQAHIHSKQHRLKNIADSMRVVKPIDPKAVYILVDDVTTTGATFNEARRALRAAGCTNILAVALAHGYARKRK